MPAKTVRAKTDDTITETPNPEYTRWVTKDQALLGYLFSSLTREVSPIVTRVEPVSHSELYSQMLSYELHLAK
jgi:hypothetical protein